MGYIGSAPSNSGGGGAGDRLTNTDGAVVVLLNGDTVFGSGILYKSPTGDPDGFFNVPHSFTIAAGANDPITDADGAGYFSPSLSLQEGGAVTVASDNPGTAGNNTIHLKATDGVYLSVDGSKPALLKLDNLSSGRTYQLADVAGTLALIAGTPPSTPTADGVVGQIEYDDDYMYLCVATNTWKRTALSTWVPPA